MRESARRVVEKGGGGRVLECARVGVGEEKERVGKRARLSMIAWCCVWFARDANSPSLRARCARDEHVSYLFDVRQASPLFGKALVQELRCVNANFA